VVLIWQAIDDSNLFFINPLNPAYNHCVGIVQHIFIPFYRDYFIFGEQMGLAHQQKNSILHSHASERTL